MNIILFGPYGSGKGTQGKILAEKFNLQSFDTGNELRKHVKNNTELGKKIADIINRGDLVPDEVIMEVVSSFIDTADKRKGFLFDGLPRKAKQAELFDTLLKEKGVQVKRIFINIPLSLSIERQVGRKTCQKCNAIYPGTYTSDTCEKCGAIMEKRVENDPAIAQKRVKVYEEETLPVIHNYLEKGLLKEIDGTMNVEKVTKGILKYLES